MPNVLELLRDNFGKMELPTAVTSDVLEAATYVFNPAENLVKTDFILDIPDLGISVSVDEWMLGELYDLSRDELSEGYVRPFLAYASDYFDCDFASSPAELSVENKVFGLNELAYAVFFVAQKLVEDAPEHIVQRFNTGFNL